MINNSSLFCRFFAFILLLSKKPLLLFKSFTDLTVQEFDDIYEELAKRYDKYEI
jgi:hypothetical protein